MFKQNQHLKTQVKFTESSSKHLKSYSLNNFFNFIDQQGNTNSLTQLNKTEIHEINCNIEMLLIKKETDAYENFLLFRF